MKAVFYNQRNARHRRPCAQEPPQGPALYQQHKPEVANLDRILYCEPTVHFKCLNSVIKFKSEEISHKSKILVSFSKRKWSGNTMATIS